MPEVEILHTLNDLSEKHADELKQIVTDDSSSVCWNWLFVQESLCLRLGYKPCYYVLFEKNEAQALFISTVLPGIFIRKGVMKPAPIRLFLGGNPLGSSSSLFAHPSVSLETFARLILSNPPASHFPLVSLFTTYGSAASAFERYTEKRYIKRPWFPTAFLDTTFSSFEEYLLSLQGSWRQIIRRNIRKFEREGCTLIRVNTLEGISDKIHELYYAVRMKYNNSPFGLDDIFFKTVEIMMQGEMRFIIAKKREKIIGFTLISKKKNIMAGRFVGIDYQIAKDTAVYFNLFYETFRLAMDEKIQRVYLGTSQEDVKRRLGCRFDTPTAFLGSPSLLMSMSIRISEPFWKGMFPKISIDSGLE